MRCHTQLFAFFRAISPSVVVRAGTGLQRLKENPGMCHPLMAWLEFSTDFGIDCCHSIKKHPLVSVLHWGEKITSIPMAYCVSMVTNIEFIVTLTYCFPVHQVPLFTHQMAPSRAAPNSYFHYLLIC